MCRHKQDRRSMRKESITTEDRTLLDVWKNTSVQITDRLNSHTSIYPTPRDAARLTGIPEVEICICLGWRLGGDYGEYHIEKANVIKEVKSKELF